MVIGELLYNFFCRSKKIILPSQRISNLKWYQPSVDTTVVKQYGPQAKQNVYPISRFKYKENLV